MVPRGALAVVLGNSGSGKTTLLRGIMQVGAFTAGLASSGVQLDPHCCGCCC